MPHSESVSPPAQLTLNLQRRDGSSFDNFQIGANREAFEQVQQLARSPSTPALRCLVLWGARGTGKTHLLEAACRVAHDAGRHPIFVPLGSRAGLSPAMLDDIDPDGLVCIDDLQAVVGDADWEGALFRLYERLRGGGTLLLAARRGPAALGLKLADLASRLAAGLVYQLRPLADADKMAALRLRADRRGFEMSEEVAQYLLARQPRDMHSLFALLDRLDSATLAAQRRLTIPFLRGLE
jgi:DnaA family protein